MLTPHLRSECFAYFRNAPAPDIRQTIVNQIDASTSMLRKFANLRKIKFILFGRRLMYSPWNATYTHWPICISDFDEMLKMRLRNYMKILLTPSIHNCCRIGVGRWSKKSYDPSDFHGPGEYPIQNSRARRKLLCAAYPRREHA